MAHGDDRSNLGTVIDGATEGVPSGAHPLGVAYRLLTGRTLVWASLVLVPVVLVGRLLGAGAWGSRQRCQPPCCIEESARGGVASFSASPMRPSVPSSSCSAENDPADPAGAHDAGYVEHQLSLGCEAATRDRTSCRCGQATPKERGLVAVSRGSTTFLVLPVILV